MDITVWVKPGSRKGPLVEAGDRTGERENSFVVFLRERAVDGRANDALVGVLATHFGVPKSSVRIVHGHASRAKRLRIDTGAEAAGEGPSGRRPAGAVE
jgi:uncharacterized protein YggU (UPF0235/DUF167 family)